VYTRSERWEIEELWVTGKHGIKWAKDMLCAEYKCRMLANMKECIRLDEYVKSNSKCSSRIDFGGIKEMVA
jgi:hypothetical protein